MLVLVKVLAAGVLFGAGGVAAQVVVRPPLSSGATTQPTSSASAGATTHPAWIDAGSIGPVRLLPDPTGSFPPPLDERGALRILVSAQPVDSESLSQSSRAVAPWRKGTVEVAGEPCRVEFFYGGLGRLIPRGESPRYFRFEPAVRYLPGNSSRTEAATDRVP